MLEPVKVPLPDIIPLMLKVLPAPMLSILPAGIVRLFMIKLEDIMGTEVEIASMLTSLSLAGTVLQPQLAGVVQSVLVVLIQLLGVIDMVILLDVAGLPVAQVALDVNSTLMVSAAANVAKVLAVSPVSRMLFLYHW